MNGLNDCARNIERRGATNGRRFISNVIGQNFSLDFFHWISTSSATLTRDFDEYLLARETKTTWQCWNQKSRIFDSLISRFDYHAKPRLAWKATKLKNGQKKPHDLRWRFLICLKSIRWINSHKTDKVGERLSENVSRRQNIKTHRQLYLESHVKKCFLTTFLPLLSFS